MSDKKIAIITGAQQGIEAGLVEGFLKAGYNVVATSLHASASLTPSPSQILCLNLWKAKNESDELPVPGELLFRVTTGHVTLL